jgi:hypothetical protein
VDRNVRNDESRSTWHLPGGSGAAGRTRGGRAVHDSVSCWKSQRGRIVHRQAS